MDPYSPVTATRAPAQKTHARVFALTLFLGPALTNAMMLVAGFIAPRVARTDPRAFILAAFHWAAIVHALAIVAVAASAFVFARDLRRYFALALRATGFVFACLVVLFNLIADVLYGWLDPRISLR